MANKNHLQVLERGVPFWNAWRSKNPSVVPDLSDVDLSHYKLAAIHLSGANLEYATFKCTNLCSADLSHANLSHARLDHAQLSQANLLDADLSYASLKGAWLNDCNLVAANLFRARLNHANLLNARLSGTILIGTHMQGANLMGSAVQSTFAWGVKLKGANQTNLVVNQPQQPRIIVDQLEIAQLVHLRLFKQNQARRFDAIPPRIVVILGHFSKSRSESLARIQELLRERDHVPLMMDCDEDTVPDYSMLSALIELASFFIIDITEPCNVIATLQHFELPSDKTIHAILQPGFSANGAARLAQWFPSKFYSPLLYETEDDLGALFDAEILPLPEDDADEEQPYTPRAETFHSV